MRTTISVAVAFLALSESAVSNAQDVLAIENQSAQRAVVHAIPPGIPGAEFKTVTIPPMETRRLELIEGLSYDLFVQWYGESDRVEELGVKQFPVWRMLNAPAGERWMVPLEHWATWIGPDGRRTKVKREEKNLIWTTITTTPEEAVLVLPQLVYKTQVHSPKVYDPPRKPRRPPRRN